MNEHSLIFAQLSRCAGTVQLFPAKYLYPDANRHGGKQVPAPIFADILPNLGSCYPLMDHEPILALRMQSGAPLEPYIGDKTTMTHLLSAYTLLCTYAYNCEIGHVLSANFLTPSAPACGKTRTCTFGGNSEEPAHKSVRAYLIMVTEEQTSPEPTKPQDPIASAVQFAAQFAGRLGGSAWVIDRDPPLMKPKPRQTD